MPSRFGPGQVFLPPERNLGHEIAAAIDEFRQTKRQGRLDEERRAAQAFSEEQARAAEERAQAGHAVDLFRAGVRTPAEDPTDVPSAIDDLRMLPPSRAPGLRTLPVPGAPITHAPSAQDDVATALESMRVQAPRGVAAGRPPVDPSVDAVRRAGQQFYQLPGTELFIDPTQTPEAIRARQEEEQFGRETARRRAEREAEERFSRQEFESESERRFRERQAEERFRREEIGLQGEQQRRTAAVRAGRTDVEDPAFKERRQGIISQLGRPVTQLQQDIVDALAEGTSPDEILAELERVHASESTVTDARRYTAALRRQF